MNDRLVVTGMVILAAPSGDYDKRLVILTKERGKITAFARGARRQNSPQLAAANPFVFGEFELFEGRNAYSLSRVTVKEYFRELTMTPERACYGFYFLEITNYFAKENADEIDSLKLLYQALRGLLSDKLNPGLIRIVFELKTLVCNGEYPNFFSCKKCGKKEDLIYFSADKNSVICKECCNSEEAMIISPACLYTLQYIVATPIEKVFNFQVNESVLRELKKVVSPYFARLVDHQFTSLDLLFEMEDLGT